MQMNVESLIDTARLGHGENALYVLDGNRPTWVLALPEGKGRRDWPGVCVAYVNAIGIGQFPPGVILCTGVDLHQASAFEYPGIDGMGEYVTKGPWRAELTFILIESDASASYKQHDFHALGLPLLPPAEH